jgi:hypothetical protein
MRKLLAVCLVALALCGGARADPCAGVPGSYHIEKPQELYGHLDQHDVDLVWGNVACCPTGATNSLLYLQNQYPGIYDQKLVPKQDQDLDGDGDKDQYDDLIAVAGKLASPGSTAYMNLKPGSGVWTDWFVYGKQKYIEEQAPGMTIYHAQFLDAWRNPDPNPEVPDPAVYGPPMSRPAYVEDTLPTWDFLYYELVKCEDVEIMVRWQTSGGHCLTLKSFDWDDLDGDGIIEAGENTGGTNPTLDFVDPWDGQCHVAQMLHQDGKIWIDYEFGKGWIGAAIAQSPIPEPFSIVFLGGTFGGVLLCRVWRRRKEGKTAA